MSIYANTQNYDLLDPQALINPYPLYQQIREQEPVYFYEKGNFWLLTRYQDVEAAFLDPRLSSCHDNVFANQLADLDVSKIQNFTKLASKFIVDKDPPEHTTLKKVLLPGFTAKSVEIWQSEIQSIVDNLLDKVADHNSMDIVNDLSLKLPSLVLTKILNIPEPERQNSIQWVRDIVNFWGFSGIGNIKEIAERADQAALQLTNLVNTLIAEREQRPGNDMISFLIAVCKQNELDLQILPSLCVELIAAGQVAIIDTIPNGINTLLNHPQQLQLLKENPELLNSAIEEMIRFDSSSQAAFRVAKENLTIGGKEIPAGSVIALGIGAAHRDPEKFPNPDVLDITRSPNEHLGFGKGTHFCVGIFLGRMQLRACFETLLKRMPNLQFDPERTSLIRRKTFIFKGFESLHVKF